MEAAHEGKDSISPESRPPFCSSGHVTVTGATVSIDKHEADGASSCRDCFQRPPAISLEMLAWLQHLGMLPSALEGWSQVYRLPLEGLTCFTVAVCSLLASLAYRLPHAPWDSWYAYVLTYPIIGGFITSSVVSACIWRHGPAVVRARALIPLVLVMAPCNICILMAGFLVPPAHTPFGSALHNTAHSSVTALALNTLSLVAPQRPPPEPMHSSRPVLIEAAVLTLRMMDALTDATFVFVLVDEARSSFTFLGTANTSAVACTLAHSWRCATAFFLDVHTSMFLCILSRCIC